MRKLLISLEFLLLYFSTEIGDNNSMEKRNEIKVGDVVKSLDFVGNNDCYYVGLVREILSDGTFRAETIERVWLGKAQEIRSFNFFAPLPGHHFADDLMFPRVQVLA